MSIAAKPSLLLAEDDPALRALAVDILAAAGYQLRACVDGRELLEALRVGPRPDLVISDIALPAMSGLRALEAARREARCPPFIVMTSLGCDEGLLEKARGLGARALLTKPFEVDVFLAAVARGLEPLEHEDRPVGAL